MPIAPVNGIEIYYETAGDPAAPPLLLITGLSSYTEGWFAQVFDLSRDFYVIYYDNRGAGRSTQPPAGYTLADMADDAAGLLDTLGMASAYVFGISQGGMIAQHLALRHPQRVRKLVLGCTTAGGASMIPPSLDVAIALLAPRSSDRGQDFLTALWFLAAPEFASRDPQSLRKLVKVSAENPQTEQGLYGQLQAMSHHDLDSELRRIQIPTLVMHGELDKLIPPENGRLLAAHIPHAQLKLYPDAGHLFMIERAAAV
ncbi:MAG: alpha/beta fold hydrolase, partial [Chloroflexota bacterium]